MAEHAQLTINDLPNLVVRRPGTIDSNYLDNAATTPFLQPVERAVAEARELYGSVHRGSGRRAKASTDAYEAAREEVASFFGLSNEHSLIFTSNTTTAINTLAGTLNDRGFYTQPCIVSTGLEHHSNDLPWQRTKGKVHYANFNPKDGSVDEDHLFRLINRYGSHTRVVAITGGSNLTGFIPDIAAIAEQAHKAGAILAIDGAQLAPHRKINMAELGIDALAVSGHKMYAPYGIGALAVRKDILARFAPIFSGGGTVSLVTEHSIDWAGLPDRFEPGTPNLLGAVAFAAATKLLREIGMDNVAKHESQLTKLALTHLRDIDGVTVFGDTNPDNTANRLGVLPFLVDAMPHAKVAAILGEEHDVDCRNGCFCAHKAVTQLLEIDAPAIQNIRAAVVGGDKTNIPGLVRFSFGAHTTAREVTAGINGIRQIVAGNHRSDYTQDARTGEFYLPSR